MTQIQAYEQAVMIHMAMYTITPIIHIPAYHTPIFTHVQCINARDSVVQYAMTRPLVH